MSEGTDQDTTGSGTSGASSGSGKATGGRAAQAENQNPAAEAPAAPDQLAHTAAEWRERARAVFDVSPHVMAGALFGANPTAVLTQNVVQDLLDEFLVREGT